LISDDVERNDALREVREARFLIDRVDEWLIEVILPWMGQRVLEVGCGWGNMAQRLAPDRRLWVAIDNDQESVQHVREMRIPNVDVVWQDICDPSVLGLCEHSFDTVLSLNVLEHIVDDKIALGHMRQLLRRGGRLILVVPAHDCLYGSMDKAIGHCRRYTKQSLQAKLNEVGFSLPYSCYLNAIGGLGWLVAGRILRRKTPPRGQLRLFNALVPYLRWAESILPPPFGVSLVVIAE
jgi:SAM-dependent methyltransferase